MADKIQTIIPRYGELNRIYRDYIDNHVFSFDRQKFIRISIGSIVTQSLLKLLSLNWCLTGKKNNTP